MNCTKKITYTIRRGDTLYSIAREFNTTVEALERLNPQINPYNLRIGSTIIICDVEQNDHFDKKIYINNSMRTALSQQAYWTRFYLISALENLQDQQATLDRLMQNPQTISQIFADFYSPEVVVSIEQMIGEHIRLMSRLLMAIKDKNMEEAGKINSLWHKNAQNIANSLSNVNSNYKSEQIEQMLFSILNATIQQTALRLSGNHDAEIEVFNNIEQETLHFADYLTQGLIDQFPSRF